MQLQIAGMAGGLELVTNGADDFLGETGKAHAGDADGRTAVAFDGCDATLFWIQRDEPKEGSEVLLRTTTGDPLLVKGTYGAGTVYAFLGTPLGDEARDAKAFWNGNADYLKTMRGLLK